MHARSGDKGGDANIGLWVGRASNGPAGRLAARHRHPRLVRELLPEAEDLDVEVFALPNLGGVNVLVHGLLGEGVAASTGSTRRPRRSASGCGRGYVDVPEELL